MSRVYLCWTKGCRNEIERGEKHCKKCKAPETVIHGYWRYRKYKCRCAACISGAKGAWLRQKRRQRQATA